MSGHPKNVTLSATLAGIGFLLGLGGVFLFGTRRGEKYRQQLGEVTADFLDCIGEGCQEIRRSLNDRSDIEGTNGNSSGAG